MAEAVAEQRRLGHDVLEVREHSILIAIEDNTPQQEERLEAFLKQLHIPKASLWRP